MSTTSKPAHNTTSLTDVELLVLWGDAYGELQDGYTLEYIRGALNRHIGHDFDSEFVDRMRVQMLYGNFPDFWRTPAWIEWKRSGQSRCGRHRSGWRDYQVCWLLLWLMALLCMPIPDLLKPQSIRTIVKNFRPNIISRPEVEISQPDSSRSMVSEGKTQTSQTWGRQNRLKLLRARAQTAKRHNGMPGTKTAAWVEVDESVVALHQTDEESWLFKRLYACCSRNIKEPSRNMIKSP